MKRLLTCFVAPVAALTLTAETASANHILGYQFNDPMPLAPDGGSAGSAPALNIVSPGMLGGPGSGVSGFANDRALDNSAANAMGGTTNSSGGRATHAADFEPIDGLLQFTIAGWFRTDGATPLGANAVIFDNRSGVAGVRVHGDPNTPGNLVLSVDNGSNSSAGFGATDEWVNFAVTYDGTAPQPGPNVFFYAGSVNTPLSLVGSGTNTNGSGNDPAMNETSALSLGSRVLFGSIDADPFDGLLDNIRVWDEVVPQSALEGIRQSDAIPEPTTAMLGAFTAIAACGFRRARRSVEA